MQEIRVGIIGAGTNTKLMHIPKLQEIPGVSVTAVCNRSEASSEKVAKEFGIRRASFHITDYHSTARLQQPIPLVKCSIPIRNVM